MRSTRLAIATGLLLAGVAVPAPALGQTATTTPPPVAPQQTEPIVDNSLIDVRAPFAYPAVFLLPVALLGGAAWAARAFTRDLTPTP